MTDAPERIWAWHTQVLGSVQIGKWADTIRYAPEGILAVEMVRHDLHTEAIAAARADALRLAVDAARQIADRNRDNWREDMAAGADEAADAIEELIPAPSPWHGIETAPKRRPILVKWAQHPGQYAVVRWSHEEAAWLEGSCDYVTGMTHWREVDDPPPANEADW